MDILTHFSPGQLWLVVAPWRHSRRHGPSPSAASLLDLTARLAMRGPVRVLDAGNRFNTYTVAHSVAQLLYDHRLSQARHLNRILDNIQAARAFTCYQVLTLLSETPAGTNPTLVLDMLVSFYDEDVTPAESERLLRECTFHLKRLSQAAPVMVSVQPHPPITGRSTLVDSLKAAAQQVLILEQEEEARGQQMAFNI
ncbi:MAG: hypothetical protein EHM70_11625 [Chloroflexota bacterium]|nr:MAG: hypothetical protein EHM70_11625 [Chloroflexota bacterium]